MLKNLRQLNPESFTFENYESNWWTLLDLDFNQSLNISEWLKDCIDQYAVGYCDATRLTVRPNHKSFAVMFEKDNEQFWFHIQKWEIEILEEENM